MAQTRTRWLRQLLRKHRLSRRRRVWIVIDNNSRQRFDHRYFLFTSDWMAVVAARSLGWEGKYLDGEIENRYSNGNVDISIIRRDLHGSTDGE